MPISKDYNYSSGKYQGSCRFCGKPTEGRINKRFCNDTCRVRYNNEINRFRKGLLLKTRAEAHNHFLLVKEFSSRALPTTLRKLDLLSLKLAGFDFDVEYLRFKDQKKGWHWFASGNVFFRVLPDDYCIQAKHFQKLEDREQDFIPEDEISIKKAYPELNLKNNFEGRFA